MTRKDKELQVSKCIQAIREIQSIRSFTVSLGDDISDALDVLDSQVEEKLQELLNREYLFQKES